MSSNRKPKTAPAKLPTNSIDWAAREKNLKALGFGPAIKGPWTDSKRQKVRRLYKEWGSIADEPKAFKKVSTKGLGPAALADLKDAGYKVKDSKAYIPLSGYSDAKLKTEYRKKKDGTFERIVSIVRTATGTDPTDKSKVTKRSETYLGSGLRQLGHLERLQGEYEQGKFRDGEWVALQTYGNSPMARSGRISIGALLKYFIDIQWKNTNSENEKERLRENTHVVKMWSSRPNLAAFEKSTNQKINESRKRSRARAKTAIRGRGKTKGRGNK